MKKTRILILLILLFMLFSITAYASDADEIWQQQQHTRMIDALPTSATRLIEGISLSDFTDLGACLQQISQQIEISTFLIGSLRSLSKMLFVILLAGICNGFQKAGTVSSLPVVTIVSALAIITALFSDLQGMLALCMQTLEQTSVFSTAMLPVMAGALTLSGAPTTASATQGITMLALSLMIEFVSSVLIPATCAYIAIVTVNAALEQDILENLGQFIKWLTTGSLKLMLTVFIGYLSISGAISGSVDAVALKTAKFAVSGSVPVVGGIISDATESMLAGMITVKNTLGILGMVGVISICLIPFLQVGLNYLIFKAGAAAFSPICSAPLRKLMAGIGDSFGIMLGMLGTCSAILFFELVFSILMVKPL